MTRSLTNSNLGKQKSKKMVGWGRWRVHVRSCACIRDCRCWKSELVTCGFVFFLFPYLFFLFLLVFSCLFFIFVLFLSLLLFCICCFYSVVVVVFVFSWKLSAAVANFFTWLFFLPCKCFVTCCCSVFADNVYYLSFLLCLKDFFFLPSPHVPFVELLLISQCFLHRWHHGCYCPTANISYSIGAAITDIDGCCCSCVAVAIKSRDHIAWPFHGNSFASVNSLLVRWGTYALANPIYVGIHEPSFVATNDDRSDCVHVTIGALQR